MTIWTEVYSRCMDGEFFRGEYCPRDGHSNDTSAWVAQAVEAARRDGVRLSIDELRLSGFDGDWADVIVVEFAEPDLAPDWFRPEGWE